MTRFFTSDLHFHHKNVINFCNRPFKDLQEMEEGLIEKFNSCVKEDDIAYLLGDIFFCGTQKAVDILRRMNGKKVLICGNHDPGTSKMMKYGFDFACYEMVIRIAGVRVRLSHFPYAPEVGIDSNDRRSDVRYLDRRPTYHEGEFLLHGHAHSDRLNRQKGNMLDIGVDGHNYKPWSEYEIESLISKWKQEQITESVK